MTCTDCDCGKSEVDATVDANPLDEEIKRKDAVMGTYLALWELSKRNAMTTEYKCHTQNGTTTHTLATSTGMCQCGLTTGDVTSNDDFSKLTQGTTTQSMDGNTTTSKWHSNNLDGNVTANDGVIYGTKTRYVPSFIPEGDVGIKHDQGKPPMSMVSHVLMEEVSEVRAFGATKYAADNWKRGFKVTRSISSALRHIFAFLSGQDKDTESGKSHLAHAVCCLEHAMWDMRFHPQNDDRYKEDR